MLDGAELSGNEVTGHELERMRDGHRHTWWQAPGTVRQDIIIRAKNILSNEDFENGVDGWTLYTAGSGAGTFAANTSGPIDGNGDALLTATTANSTTNVVIALYVSLVFLKANRSYRFMFRAMVQDGAQKTIRFGFLKDDLTEDANFYEDTEYAGTTDGGHYVDVTPTADGWRTNWGVTSAQAAAAALDAGADFIGANCSVGSDDMIDVVKALRDVAPDAVILVHPSAGQPIPQDDGSVIYPETPEMMAANVPKLIEAGANIIGLRPRLDFGIPRSSRTPRISKPFLSWELRLPQPRCFDTEYTETDFLAACN